MGSSHLEIVNKLKHIWYSKCGPGTTLSNLLHFPYPLCLKLAILSSDQAFWFLFLLNSNNWLRISEVIFTMALVSELPFQCSRFQYLWQSTPLNKDNVSQLCKVPWDSTHTLLYSNKPSQSTIVNILLFYSKLHISC